MGYLGKISAIVSANTSDFSAKLAASGKEVASWARALNSAVNTASSKASSSLRGIYTEAQKTERALQAIQTGKIKFKGFEGQNLAAAVSRMQALVSATKGVNEPLNQAARSLEKLPIAMQGGFIEAMKRAQAQAERLAFEIDKIGSGNLVSGSALEKKFEAIANRAKLTAEAVDRLKEAAAAVDGLSTGRELQFRNPEFAAEMARARSVQAQAAATPGGDFSGIIERQRAAADATAEAFARMEEAQLTIGGDVAGTTAEYQKQLGVLRSIGTEIERTVSATRSQTRAFTLLPATQQARGSGLFGSQSGTDEERALARARALSAEYARLPQSAQAGLQGLAGIAARVANAVAEGTANANQLNQVLDRLSVGVTAGGIQAGRQDIARQIGNSFLNILTPAEAAADTLEAHAQALGRRMGNTFLNILTPAEAAADTAEAHTQSLRRQIGNTFLGILTPAEAAADTLEAHAQALGRRMGNTFLNILTPAEAAADTAEAYRARAASRFLQINMQESDVLSNEGATTPLTGDRTPRARLLAQLGGEIAVARRQIRGLAEPLTDYLGPEIDRITIRFQAMARDGIRINVEEAERLSREVAAITSAMNARRAAGQRFMESFGGAGTAGLGLGVDTRSLQSVGAQIEFVQGRLAMLAAEARGPVLVALQRLREAAQRLFNAGEIDTETGRAELAALRNDLARTLAAAEGGSPRGIMAGMTRVGDIARGGMDRFSLGVQQAVFAVDDFFSVTGDMQQRIRAVGNNLTQLGFIVGSTRGLIIALAGSLAAQGIVALIKWANDGRTAEDQTKALNDALARQKSLVEELAQAFRSFGDAVSRSAFSKAGQSARQFSNEIEEIAKKQEKIRRGRVADIDPDVQRERANQSVLQGRLEKETNIGRRIELQRQIRESKSREEAAADRATARPAPTADAASQAIDRAARVLFERVTQGEDTVTAGDVRILDEAERRAAGAMNAGPAGARAMLVAQRDALSSSGFSDDPRVAEEIRQLTVLIEALEAPIRKANDALVIRILEGSVRVAKSLEHAQQLLDHALLPFSSISAEADKAAKRIEQIAAEIEKAGDDQAKINALEAERAALEDQANAYRSAAESVRGFADVIQRVSQELLDTVASEMRGEADRARRDTNRARAEMDVRQGRAAGQRYTLGPNGELVTGDEQQRDARRTTARRDQLEKDARASEQRAFEARQENERVVKKFEDLARAGALGDDAQRLIKERDEQRAIANDETKSEKERLEARQRADRAQRELDQRYEATWDGQAARAQADTADRMAQADRARVEQEDRRIEAARRGREFAGGESMRAAEEFVNRRFQLQQAAAEGMITPQQQAEAEVRARREASERVAPAWFSMMEEVLNSVAQGPSRAALNASDASSVEGQRELNRLIRGEDSARDVNLMELEKQTDELRKLNEQIRAHGVAVAN